MTAHVRAIEAEIPMGISAAEDGDAKVLFVRDQNGLRAFQASCPHAGAPLADGKLCGHTLYCPWHKAAFDVGDGALLQPPALAGLEQYPIRTEGEKIVVTLEPMAVSKPSARAHDERTFVIVGTGAAACAATITLRHEGFGGRILMIAREAGEPYDRTMLSKGFLAEKSDASRVALEKGFFETYRVELIDGPATSIDPAKRAVALQNGEVVTGDALLIATGSRARMPEFAGGDLTNIFFLRSLADATALTDAADKAKSIAIVGSGFIALEAAAFLTQRGLAVTVVAADALPLAPRLGDEIGRAIKVHHEGTGVRFVQGNVARFEGSGSVERLRLEGGETIDTELVLVAVGAAPETESIANTKKEPDGSLAADAHLRIAPGAWIAGDIATFPLPDGRRARIEHWRLAEQHGRHAARAMLGDAAPFADAPFFWSRQGEMSIGYAGYVHEWDEIVMHGSPAKLDCIAYYVRDGQALAACAIGQDDPLIEVLDGLGHGRMPRADDLKGRARAA